MNHPINRITTRITRVSTLLLALASALWLAPDLVSAAALTRGPYLQMGNDSAVSVRWRSDVATNSRVRVGTDPANLNLTFDAAASVTNHVVRATGLAANTRYYYSVGSSTQVLAGGNSTTFFETAPLPGAQQATRVWVIGDSGTADSNARAVYNAYRTHTGITHTDLWLMLGDNAYNDGTDAQYQAAVFNTYPELLRQSVLWPTLGNHDGYSADSATQTGPYYDIFTLPRNAEAGGIASGTEAYYSYDHGNIHFVVLDSYDTSRAVGSPMLSWLEADLQATDRDWIIAFWHHPPYTKGSHNSDTESALIEMRANALPILENHGVDLVLTGHSHSYERSRFIDGHYGSSSTFSTATHVEQVGGGAASDPYRKAPGGAPRDGAVYSVVGSSGKISGGSLNHPAMFVSLNALGSMVIDINGQVLSARFLDNTGATRDSFVIDKTGAPAGSTVSGQTWNDTDQDGVREAGEPARAGIEVRLYTSANALVGTQFTSGSGTYSFGNVAAGSYYVRFIRGVLTLSPQNQGANDAADSDASPSSGNTAVFAVSSGVNVGNVDAGLYSVGGPTPVTVSFQNGLNGYTGNDDTYVASGAAGSNFGSATTIFADGDDGSRDRLIALLKWNVSAIPAGRTVTGASITIEVSDPSSGTYTLRGMNAAWSESGANWSNTNPPANQGSVIASFVPSANGSRSLSLNSAGLALVQGWVNGGANNGVMVIDATTTNGLDLRASEYATQAQRPRLTVTYQ